MNRDKIIVRTSIIGILANVFLAGFKAAVGLISGSIAIVLDAVNNLSDALSSVITIIGTKLAGRPADRKHPYGHGRIEYISATIISMIVLYAGITSFIESIRKIMDPVVPDYSIASLIIVAAGVAVKIILGRYVKSVGQKVDSDSLVNSGEDAINDSVISASTLVAAVIFLLWHVSLEAYLGVIISAVIIKSGVDMLNDTLSRILGERVDSDLAKEIKKTACEPENALGAYDLTLHDYGPDRMVGSIHIEVPDYMTADQLDVMTRQIQEAVYEKHHVILNTVGFYSKNTKSDEAARMYENIRRIITSHDHVKQIHGFYADLEKKEIRADIVIDFDAEDRHGEFAQITEEVRNAYPGYSVRFVMDLDTSD